MREVSTLSFTFCDSDYGVNEAFCIKQTSFGETAGLLTGLGKIVDWPKILGVIILLIGKEDKKINKTKCVKT